MCTSRRSGLALHHRYQRIELPAERTDFGLECTDLGLDERFHLRVECIDLGLKSTDLCVNLGLDVTSSIF